ncbi:helix-turn-helix domain-containing protein [Lysinibacillus sp. NPDC093692]|uniref:helix-turn-helix domain-containing protein n=1 Tax=Lysinibacillus sp. NPDC093692 TaxID=3390578 RepID=UPI003CFEB689
MSEKTLGELIRQYRKESNLTQKELAKKLNKAESTVRMWELNKNAPSLETLRDISASLDIPLGELMLQAGYIDEFHEMAKENFKKNRSIPTFGETIKQARSEFDNKADYITLDDLSKKTNIPKSTLKEIENDVNIYLNNEQISLLSNALDVNYSYLFLLKHSGDFINRLGLLPKSIVNEVSSLTFSEYFKTFHVSYFGESGGEDTAKDFYKRITSVKQVDDLFRSFTMSSNSFDFDTIYNLGVIASKLNNRTLSKNDIQKIINKISEMTDEFEYQD